MATNGGLSPVGGMGGYGGGDVPTVAFKIASAASADMFQGDVMKAVTDGSVVAMAAVGDVGIVGVAVGFEWTNADGQRVHSNKYTDTITQDDTIAYIIVNPYQLYEVKIANADVDSTLVDIGIFSNYDIEFNAGDSSSGRSGMVLDSGTAAATGAANLRLVGLTNPQGKGPAQGAANSATFTHALVMIDPQISAWQTDTAI